MDHGHLGFGLAVSGGDADRTGLANVPALRHDAAQDLGALFGGTRGRRGHVALLHDAALHQLEVGHLGENAVGHHQVVLIDREPVPDRAHGAPPSAAIRASSTKSCRPMAKAVDVAAGRS